MKRAVSFGNLEIRQYSRCLGDNPATRNGPPLTIDWSYVDAGSVALDDYENSRPRRRQTNAMLLSGPDRQSILLEETNTTLKEIDAVRTQILNSRHQRQLSIAMQEFDEWQHVLESLKRKLKRFRSGNGTSLGKCPETK